jgi:hypothetical protein
LVSHERNILKIIGKVLHQSVETKLFVSAIIRGEDCTIAKHKSVTALQRYILGLSHNALGLWRKDVTSKSIAQLKGAVISNCLSLW